MPKIVLKYNCHQCSRPIGFVTSMLDKEAFILKTHQDMKSRGWSIDGRRCTCPRCLNRKRMLAILENDDFNTIPLFTGIANVQAGEQRESQVNYEFYGR